MRDAIVVHTISQESTHVSTQQTGSYNIVAQLTKHTAHVQALAAGSLLRHDTVHIVHNQMIDRITRIDRRVHRNGENHHSPLFT